MGFDSITQGTAHGLREAGFPQDLVQGQQNFAWKDGEIKDYTSGELDPDASLIPTLERLQECLPDYSVSFDEVKQTYTASVEDESLEAHTAEEAMSKLFIRRVVNPQ